MAMMSFHRALRYARSRKTNAAEGLLDKRFKSRSIDVSHDIDDTQFYANPSNSWMDEEDLDDYVHLIGIGCTASLVTDRSKKGEYRVHVAAQTLRRTVVFSIQLVKGARSRQEEERLVADLILNVVETTRRSTLNPIVCPKSPREEIGEAVPVSEQPLCNTFSLGTTDDFQLDEIVPLMLKEGEKVQGKLVIGSPPLVDLFFGKTWAVLWKNGEIRHFKLRKELPTTQPLLFNPQAEFTQAIFSGSFNPIHEGHLEMIDIAEHRLGSRVALEISVQNVDKPPLDYIELQYRLREIEKTRPDQGVWFTQTPLFEDKAELFRGTTFIVGADTLRRFADLRFYHESTHQLHDVLRMIAFYNCRFLVFARKISERVESLETLRIPDMLRSLCDEIPPSEFAMNISSSEMRREEF